MSASNQRRDRLDIDIEPGLRRRIEEMAASQGRSVREYVEDILRQTVGSSAPVTDTDESVTSGVLVPRMTEEERTRALEAIANVKRLSAELFEKHGPHVPESWELINAARDERTRHLSRLAGLDEE